MKSIDKEKINRVILISGKLRSGKNQFADYLRDKFEKHGKSVNCDLFAKGVKDGCNQDFTQLCEYLNNLVDKVLPYICRNCVPQNIRDQLTQLKTTEENFYEHKTTLTRILLQLYGTEIFRNRVDINYWVHQLIKRVKSNEDYVSIITDVRFPNEIDIIKNNADLISCTIRINRNLNREEEINEHPSEIALDEHNNWDFNIENDGTLEDLKASAENIYKRLQKTRKFGRKW